MARSAFAGHRI